MARPIVRSTRARVRYAVGLRRFFGDRLQPDRCGALVAERHARRSESMLDLFERGIYANRRSPYRRLLIAAGIEYGDVAALIADTGVEATLIRLYEEGVRISIDEFKGRVPIRRLGLEWRADPGDFDNPLLCRHFEARSRASVTDSG